MEVREYDDVRLKDGREGTALALAGGMFYLDTYEAPPEGEFPDFSPDDVVEILHRNEK